MGQGISLNHELFILLHTHSIVCATVQSQCSEYLVYITLGRSQKVEICRHILAEINLIDWRQNSKVRRSRQIQCARTYRVRSFLQRTSSSSQRAVSEEAVAQQGTQWGCTVFDAIIRFCFPLFMMLFNNFMFK